MQIKTFAAIDIGSYEVEMKIFELSQGKGMREIDCVRRRLEMGKDTYSKGKVSVEKIEALCQLLESFLGIMKGYQVDAYRACATSAIRESKNRIVLLDYIENRTGLQIEVLGNAEQRFMDYKSIASKENEFNRLILKPTAIVDVGGGSVQISLFDKDSLVTTQNVRMGNLRLREKLAVLERSTTHMELMLQEVIDNELKGFKKLYLKDKEIKNLIVVGDHIADLARANAMSREEFFQLYDQVMHSSLDDVAQKFEVAVEGVTLLLPSLVIYKRFMEEIGAETIWMPGLNLCDGIAYEYAVQNKIIKAAHNFDEDIIASARNMAKRYLCSKNHIKVLEELALGIFDKMKRIHGLTKRDRLLLQIAVILHGCGKYISLSDVGECSYSIIMATEIIGLSQAEREIIANVVKFNTQEFEYYETISSYTSLNKQAYLTITKLTAILRLANAMDRSHKQKFKNVKMVLKNRELAIHVTTNEDITLEKGFFPEKAAFFEEVFAIRPVIRQRKMM